MVVIGKSLRYVCEICGQSYTDLIVATNCEQDCQRILGVKEEIKTLSRL